MSRVTRFVRARAIAQGAQMSIGPITRAAPSYPAVLDRHFDQATHRAHVTHAVHRASAPGAPTPDTFGAMAVLIAVSSLAWYDTGESACSSNCRA